MKSKMSRQMIGLSKKEVIKVITEFVHEILGKGTGLISAT